jgi:transposase-like protein
MGSLSYFFIIESANHQIRKIIKNKSAFPNDKSIQNIVYLALKNPYKMNYADKKLAPSFKPI